MEQHRIMGTVVIAEARDDGIKKKIRGDIRGGCRTFNGDEFISPRGVVFNRND